MEMSSQEKTKDDCRFIFLSPGVFRSDGQNLHFTAYDTHLRNRVLIQRYSRQLSKEAFSQVHLLRHLDHDNLALVHHLMQLSASGPCYLVSELLDTTLEQLLLSNQLTFNHASLFAYQMLRGLKYLHSAEIDHLRMNPSNILINVHSLILKLSDSWLSSTDQTHTDYNYSSPELLMGLEEVGDVQRADVWSVGCMLLEMVADRNIFQGHDQLDILLRIVDTVLLKEYDWMKVFKFFPSQVLKNHTCKPRHPLSHFVPAFDASLINLLESMLRFSGKERISVVESLAHPFFISYHCPEDEPVVDPDVLRILQRLSWHQEEGGPWLGEGCSLEELWSLELQAGFSENHLFDYLSTPSFLHPSTLLTSSSFSEHPFGSCHSVHDATREQSLSSSSSGSVHSAATYRHNLKELQSRLKQRYAGDSDKESAEMSEEKRKEDEEVAMVHQALQQLACVNIHDVVVEEKAARYNEGCAKEGKDGKVNEMKINDLNISDMVSEDNKKMLKLKEAPASTTAATAAAAAAATAAAAMATCTELHDSLTEVPPLATHDSTVVACSRKEVMWSRENGSKKKSRTSGKMEVGKRASEGGESWKLEGKQGLETDPFDHPPSHFDHLYRLPTDHLRRYADDMNHSLQGHHLFDALCRSSRLSEGGACGGFDYGSLDDIPSAFSSSHHLSNSPEHFQQPPMPTLLKRSGSDSSFDSPPNSPPFSSLHTGARPKRTYKKFFK